ncbi:hypothetical protein EIN_487970 [Entamoeba invadens IP1]|uniref:Uncharacterized protein n=1 Tax=Entamoeba invadens IP1 TaxID=370355 RepID=A0A0A1U8B8_ENTIV|nr:hypothetical protein EIN_487970 [Entamoeba invadens IP1]ELP89285.1 hypothetical protein EIN_487970 [Entamoeba invadens IP1]|eukprot:XP_004256056.1 hypothetical protein EIN_487970 [Entamoeba invadens IP1]
MDKEVLSHVFIYTESFSTVFKLMCVSKKCQDVFHSLKINPYITDVFLPNKLFKYFPSLITLRFPIDKIRLFEKEEINQIKFIDLGLHTKTDMTVVPPHFITKIVAIYINANTTFSLTGCTKLLTAKLNVTNNKDLNVACIPNLRTLYYETQLPNISMKKIRKMSELNKNLNLIILPHSSQNYSPVTVSRGSVKFVQDLLTEKHTPSIEGNIFRAKTDSFIIEDYENMLFHSQVSEIHIECTTMGVLTLDLERFKLLTVLEIISEDVKNLTVTLPTFHETNTNRVKIVSKAKNLIINRLECSSKFEEMYLEGSMRNCLFKTGSVIEKLTLKTTAQVTNTNVEKVSWKEITYEGNFGAKELTVTPFRSRIIKVNIPTLKTFFVIYENKKQKFVDVKNWFKKEVAEKIGDCRYAAYLVEQGKPNKLLVSNDEDVLKEVKKKEDVLQSDKEDLGMYEDLESKYEPMRREKPNEWW